MASRARSACDICAERYGTVTVCVTLFV
jgi:hypothetical protein